MDYEANSGVYIDQHESSSRFERLDSAGQYIPRAYKTGMLCGEKNVARANRDLKLVTHLCGAKRNFQLTSRRKKNDLHDSISGAQLFDSNSKEIFETGRLSDR